MSAVYVLMLKAEQPADDGNLRAAWSVLSAQPGVVAAVAGPATAGGWAGVLVARAGQAIAADDAGGGPDGVDPEAMRALYRAAPGLEWSGSEDFQFVMAGLPADGCAFVQVMEATVSDREAWAKVDSEGVPRFAAVRPDFLGSLRVWRPGGRLTVIDSFTSEAEARAGEAVPPPPGDQAVYDAWFGFLSDVVWHDLVNPWRP